MGTVGALFVLFRQTYLTGKQNQYTFRPWIYREDYDEYLPLKVTRTAWKNEILILIKFENHGKLAPHTKNGRIKLSSEPINTMENSAELHIAHGLFPNQIALISYRSDNEELFKEVDAKKQLYIGVVLQYTYDNKNKSIGEYRALFKVTLTVSEHGGGGTHIEIIEESIE
jgi:hypothetical protein